MKNKNLIIYIIICLIIIAGVAVWQSKGFKEELQFSSRKQIQLSNHTAIDLSDIDAIASEVLGDTDYIVQPVETFGNWVSIIARDITEEQRDKIVEKYKEKYKDSDINKEDVEITSIPFTRIKDIIKPFIAPGVASLALITAYFAIRFSKLGTIKVILKTIITSVVAELLMFSIMSIFRIPFSRIAVALGVALYVIVIAVLTIIFENQRNKYLEEVDNEEKIENINED